MKLKDVIVIDRDFLEAMKKNLLTPPVDFLAKASLATIASIESSSKPLTPLMEQAVIEHMKGFAKELAYKEWYFLDTPNFKDKWANENEDLGYKTTDELIQLYFTDLVKQYFLNKEFDI